MRNLYGNWNFYMMRNILFMSLVMIFLIDVQAQENQSTSGAAAPVQASREPAQMDASGKPERKKNLSFEDELVEGATQKPELFYLFQKKNFNYKRLIKLRENFLPEMRKTSEDLQRVRSSN
jgi:hypothetical protein